MPALQTKIEGKGNGIKTVIPNMDEIAKALSRPATCKPRSSAVTSARNKLTTIIPGVDPTKFFGCELGAQTSFANDRYLVNGQHQADRLRELLDAFIDKFVLCAACKNPETVLIVDPKKEEITRDCKACGEHSAIDMRHKLTTFILKNPPAGSGKSSSGKKSKKGKGGGGDETPVPKDKYAEAEAMREAQMSGSNFLTINTNGKSAPAATEEEDEIAKQFKNAPSPATRTVDDDDWAVDTSADAVAARMKNLAVNVDGFSGGLGDDDDDNAGGETKYDVFGAWLAENKDGVSEADIVTQAKESGVWGKPKVATAVAENIWSDNMVKDVEKWEKILNAVRSAASFATMRSSLFIALTHSPFPNPLSVHRFG
jgi:translation initiation factor 5